MSCSPEFHTDYVGHDRIYAQRRADGRPGWDDEYESRFAVLDAWLKNNHVPKRGRLLELGCGAGNLSLRLAAAGYDVTAVDIAPSAIRWAQDRARETEFRIQFIEADVLSLDQILQFASFDVVYDSHCFHCIIGSDRAQFLHVARDLLKASGLLHIETMCGDTQHEKIAEQLDPDSRNLVSQGIATRHLGHRETIENEVRSAGLNIVSSMLIENEITPDLLLLDARV